MQAATVLPASESNLEGFRQMFHDKVDRWIDDHVAPLFAEGQQPTLRELSERFQSTRSEFLGPGLVELAQRLHAGEIDPDVAECPQCGKRLPRKRLGKRTVSTLQGEASLPRGYFYCPECQQGFHPADAALGLAPQHHQFDVQAHAAGLAAEMPFATSAAWFTRLTGIEIGNHFSHQTLLAVGAVASLELVTPDAATIRRKIAEAKGTGDEKPILVVTADGANMPLRPPGPRKGKRGPGDYKDAKGFRLFLVGPGERLLQVASWHQVQDKAGLLEALQLVAQRIPVEQVRIALLADGAPYLWDVLTRCFPTGRPILDYYHCAEHIHAVARVQYGESLLAREWAESMKARIWAGNVRSAVYHLRHGVPPTSKKGADEIRKLINYLLANEERIDYAVNRQEGYPTGSGGMESAHKAICHTRIKRSGAWWLEESCNEMLRIRCALYNETFDRVFDEYMATQHPSALRVVKNK